MLAEGSWTLFRSGPFFRVDFFQGRHGIKFNIAVFFDAKQWMAYLFPRGKHRPAVFHTGELTVSPASIDLCGIFVVPLATDFERINCQSIAAIFREVTLPDEQFRDVAAKLEREP